ncbi:DUF4097 domain-containing protein [Candidatus Latescibacterota bacterium]
MNTTKQQLIILTCLLIILMGATQAVSISTNGSSDSGILGNEVTERIEITLAGKTGMDVTLEHSFGNIDIRTGTSDKIVLIGEKRVVARNKSITAEFLSKMKLVVAERSNGVRIVTEYPDEKSLKKKVKRFSISYSIEVPPDIRLNVKNSFGEIEITGVSGDIEITNGYGNLIATDLKGTTTLTNKFGAVKVVNIKGDAEITSAHSPLEINDIYGDLTAVTRHGSIKIVHVEGSARIECGHGSVIVEDISEGTNIVNSHGKVECRNIGGEIDINNSHGSVIVEDAQSRAKIKTSFNRATVLRINGDVVVENEHGSVEANTISGSAEINTTFGSVRIDQVEDDVLVTNHHGKISVQNILAESSSASRSIRLKSTHGSINLRVPESFSANITASTSFGKFACDFPLYMSLGKEGLSSGSSQRVTGKVGDGKDTVILETTHSNISLEKM